MTTRFAPFCLYTFFHHAATHQQLCFCWNHLSTFLFQSADILPLMIHLQLGFFELSDDQMFALKRMKEFALCLSENMFIIGIHFTGFLLKSVYLFLKLLSLNATLFRHGSVVRGIIKFARMTWRFHLLFTSQIIYNPKNIRRVV